MEISKIRNWVRQLINDMSKKDGHDVFQHDSSSVYHISEDFPDASSIKVYKNGTLLNNANYTYDADTNQVTINATLVTGDDIELTYDYYAKYSDTELNGYIEGSLLYFTEFRHSKIFEVDSNEDLDNPEVVAENDEGPTTSEGHLISLVAAIHIDPQNVHLRTPDITRSPTQFASKKDQIRDTINRWQRTLGTISFLEDENHGN